MHNLSKSGERPHKCRFENCQKSFITLGNLKAHEDHHFGKKPYVCTYENCNVRYTRYSRLLIHIRTHTGVKPFKCPFGGCDKSFNEKGNLKTHCRIHTGERPFVCRFEGCKRAFKAHGHLKDHEKMHTKLRPYECKMCGKSYGRSGILKNHLKTHLKNRNFECSTCGKLFSEQSFLDEHSKTHNLKIENAKSLLDGSLPTQMNEQKEHDDNITISCTSNERTPMNFFQFKVSSINLPENSPNTPRQTENKIENVIPNNNLLNLMKIPKNIEQNPIQNLNMPTPLNSYLNNSIINGLDETPTRTPLSRMESKIKQCINNGKDTINYEEAILLYEFYNNCVSKYMNLYSNDIKYANFFSHFTEYMMNKENGNISLEKILNLLNYNKMYLNEVNQASNIVNNSNINLLNYVIGSPQVLNPHNQDINSINNIRNIIDSSPRFPILGNGLSAFSPICYNNLSKFNNANSNSNTVTNNNNKNNFSAPRNIHNNSTFSDYMSLYK